jgi:hypothetical protein
VLKGNDRCDQDVTKPVKLGVSEPESLRA